MFQGGVNFFGMDVPHWWCMDLRLWQSSVGEVVTGLHVLTCLGICIMN